MTSRRVEFMITLLSALTKPRTVPELVRFSRMSHWEVEAFLEGLGKLLELEVRDVTKIGYLKGPITTLKTYRLLKPILAKKTAPVRHRGGVARLTNEEIASIHRIFALCTGPRPLPGEPGEHPVPGEPRIATAAPGGIFPGYPASVVRTRKRKRARNSLAYWRIKLAEDAAQKKARALGCTVHSL